MKALIAAFVRFAGFIVDYLTLCRVCPVHVQRADDLVLQIEEIRERFEAQVQDLKSERDYYRSQIDFLTGKSVARKDTEAFIPAGLPASRAKGLAAIEAERRKAYWDRVNKENEGAHLPDGATTVS